jgi:hypothetical protein
MKTKEATIFDKARGLAKKNDGWMTPTTDAPRERASRTDFGNWLQEEIEGWEQTDHFTILYGNQLILLAQTEAEKLGKTGEAWLGIYEELRDEFWEQWAETHNAYQHWSQHIRKVK